MNGPCHYCGAMDDNRPYGPSGAWVCFPCAMATPEREAEASKQFTTQLLACAGVTIIGEETGPRPAVPGSI